VFGSAVLTDGTIGDGQEDLIGGYFISSVGGGTVGDNVYGISTLSQIAGGTVSGDAYGGRFLADLNSGTVTGNVYGIYALVDIEAAMTSVGGSAYGHYIDVDDDQGVSGTVYMLYLNEQTGIDYGIYQNGTALNLFGGAVAPSSSDGAALGTTTLEWSDLYLADGAVIYGGDDQEVTLTHVPDTGWLLNTTMQLQFRDSAVYIASLTDGHLDLTADTNIDLNANIINFGTNSDTDVIMVFYGNTSNGQISWMEDEGYFQFHDHILIDAAFRAYFRDTNIYIASLTDGHLDLEADISVDVNSTLLVEVNCSPQASDGAALGTTDLEWSDLYLADGGVIYGGDDQDVRLSFVPDVGMTLAGTTGDSLGMGTAADVNAHLSLLDAALAPSAAYYGIRSSHTILDATSMTQVNDVFGFYNYMQVSDAGETVGHLYGVYTDIMLTAGSIGDDEDMISGNFLTRQSGGTVSRNSIGVYAGLDQNGGTISGDAIGVYISADLDGTVTGTAYMLYLDENTGIDYGIYQNGTAPNAFGGALVPTTSDAAALGSASLEWSDIYLADGAVIYGGDDQEITLTHVADVGWTLDGTSGASLGIGITADTQHHLYINDSTADITADYWGIHNLHIKTTGNTTNAVDLVAVLNWIEMADADQTIGNLFGENVRAEISAGTIDTDIQGIRNNVACAGGTVNASIYGIRTFVDIDAAMTSVGGNVFGEYIDVDDDQGVGGTVYMVYLNEHTGIDYGIYQNGSAENRFGGVVNAVGGFEDNGVAGIDDTWVNNEGNTVTVSGGIITDVS